MKIESVELIQTGIAAVSAFLVIGLFGGVERGSMEGWQLILALILISVINLAMNAIVRIRKGHEHE